MATRRNVVAGPSKFDLMLSIMERKTIAFSLEALRQPLAVIVTGLEQEDGSTESWIVQGFVTEGPEKSKKFSGYFRTNRRSGYIEVT